MPQYSYLCETCENAFDVLKKVSDIDNPESCPKCGHEAVRTLATGSFKFQGGSPTRSRQGV